MRVRRWIAVAAITGTATAAVASPSHAATSAYGRQLDASAALFSIVGSNNAAAQAFTTDETHVGQVSAYLDDASDTGTIDAQLRTDVTDSASAVADDTVSIDDLGGTGQGWVNFSFDATVTPGRTYYLVLQASDTDGKVVWNGTKSAVAGALPSWNYDESYWGGWKEYGSDTPYADYHAAFGVDLSGADACAASNTCYRHIPAADLGVYTAGLQGNGTTTVAVSPIQAYGAHYVSGSDVLVLPDGEWRYVPGGATAAVTVPAGDSGARARIRQTRRWLASGTVPGRTGTQRTMAARALLDLHLLQQRSGAVEAAHYGAWEYNWPRDSSFAAVALAVTGHGDDAYRALSFDASTQKSDGSWDARTLLTGPQVPDGRAPQLDADGWVPWAIWQWYRAASGKHVTRQQARRLRNLWPTVRAAAELMSGSLDDDGLPPASPDYWEIGTDAPNIGTAAPWLAGLRASASLARTLGHRGAARTWRGAAKRLSTGIARTFGKDGYTRTIDGHGRDSAVTFMTGPYNTAPRGLATAIDDTFTALRGSNGGVVPGNDPDHTWKTTWTPETMFFALAWSNSRATSSRSESLLGWLADRRTVLGALPEQVDASGISVSVAPLGWTDALALLTMHQLDGRRIPVPRSD